ncbi:MAG: FKBP-type peptidyl-prolyl cis-trans isomerase [Opitutaceae bacterium]|nr:FKBP-type peptidyl-prolyl cis-trans isomerase [Opitutaceae bacterium]
MLEFYGWYLGQQFQCEALGLSEPELEAFTRGIKMAAAGQRTQADPRTVGPALERFLTSRSETVEKKRLADSQAEQDTFLAEIDKKEGVKKTASGLRYQVVTEGTGPKPGPTDEVRVHYRGTFVDGTVFDSSIERGEPATFPVNRVIPGWSEGVQLMSVGGKYMFYVPGDLGYGLRGSDGIPPGKLLIFEVELLATQPPAPQLPGAGPLPTLAP